MFDLGFGEMLVIAVLVIVFVGPDGLPDMMRCLLYTSPSPRD